MAQQRIWHLPLSQLAQPTVIVIIALSGGILLNMGLIFLPEYSPFLSTIVMLAMILIVFFFLQPCWAIPVYILLAAPTIVLIPTSTGIFSRLYPGNLLLALVLVIGFVQALRSQRTSGRHFPPISLMLPLFALALVGLASIMYSRILPDPHVVYSFQHSDASLIVINIVEMLLLLGLPVMLIIIPGLMRTAGNVKWIVRAYIGVGMLYALGTIFAGPLGLYSENVILGNRRPKVFGAESSGLGLFLVLFTNIALGQALYANTQRARFCWWVLTVIGGIAVILSFGRTAWLALLLSVLVMIGFRSKNLSILFCALLCLSLLLIPGVTDFFNPDKVYGVDRVNIAQDALSIWQIHPYFGVGAGNYQFFDIAYGTDVAGVAHNQFLEVLAEMGVQGLLCLIWSLLAIGWLTFRHFKTAMTAQGKAIALAYMGYYSAIIFTGFFADSFLPSVAGAGGTATLIGSGYQWFLLGVVLTIPQWEKSALVAAQSDQPVKKLSQTTKLRAYAEPLSSRFN